MSPVSTGEMLPLTFGLCGVFEERDLCIITVPTESPQLQLLQSFVRLDSNSQFQEGYVCHRSGLRCDIMTCQSWQLLTAMCSCFICSSSSSIKVRWAVAADRPAVSDLVTGLRLSGTLLQALDSYYETRRDLVSLYKFDVKKWVSGTRKLDSRTTKTDCKINYTI